MCGLSMGGVHASMTAGLYQGEVAVAPLLAPRSAAVAYCDGAMRVGARVGGRKGNGFQGPCRLSGTEGPEEGESGIGWSQHEATPWLVRLGQAEGPDV